VFNSGLETIKYLGNIQQLITHRDLFSFPKLNDRKPQTGAAKTLQEFESCSFLCLKKREKYIF